MVLLPAIQRGAVFKTRGDSEVLVIKYFATRGDEDSLCLSSDVREEVLLVSASATEEADLMGSG